MQNLLNDLSDLLKKDDRFVSDGKLIKNNVIEAALQVDPGLIKLLLSHKTFKKHFFTDVNGVYVFDKIEFQKFVSNKSFLKDSYTAFSNKIGLTTNDEFISERKEVVLSWPHKDCVLEGGQTKEDEKRDEIFWNETLAPDEIDRLLSPKVFTNFKKYDSKGEHKVNDISLEDNLIIKGNNLLALHSLLPIYRGRIKLIYIDPPYNTGNDSFKYNDRFNHSTWLTFMKNRLEVAHQLLSFDGCIFIQLDDNEVAYFKILCDEIFQRENYCNQISLETNSPFGYKSTSKNLFKQTSFILLYAKNKSLFNINKLLVERKYDPAYRFIFENISIAENKWTWKDLNSVVATSLSFKDKKEAISALGEDNFLNELANYALNNADRVFRTASVTGGAYKKREKTIKLSKKNKNKIIRHPSDDMDYMFIGGERVLFYKERLSTIDGEIVPASLLTDLWTDISVEGIAKEGGVVLERGKKPEQLIRRIIELSTKTNDIVLDFNLGSGTTCAVAQKLGRKYIGIEQLDYGDNDSVQRLINVINGDASGVSKAVGWKSGGSFVYSELAELNQMFVTQIKSAKTTKELKSIWSSIKKDGFISYKVNPTEIDKSISEFEELSIVDQKKFLIEVLDKNHLYVNYSEIDDKDYNISTDDKKLNKKFYSLK